MSYRIEKALVYQAPILAELINQHELAIDPESSSIGLEESVEILEGSFDPAIAAFMYLEDSQEPSAFYSINPDSNRTRLFTDVYARPGSGLIREALIESLRAGAAAHPDYQHWFSVNTKDTQMRSAMESLGMKVIRTYWHMKKNLTSGDQVRIENKDVRIYLIETEDQMKTWWELHQDSFSKHFGFAPREITLWIEQTLSAGTHDPAGCFILEYRGESAGFVQLANGNGHLNGGYVQGLGVAHRFQGLGLGKALLQHAVNRCVELGRDFVELNVDTGNESGALRLYEKLGFKPNSAWEQYENKNWVEFVRGL